MCKPLYEYIFKHLYISLARPVGARVSERAHAAEAGAVLGAVLDESARAPVRASAPPPAASRHARPRCASHASLAGWHLPFLTRLCLCKPTVRSTCVRVRVRVLVRVCVCDMVRSGTGYGFSLLVWIHNTFRRGAIRDRQFIVPLLCAVSRLRVRDSRFPEAARRAHPQSHCHSLHT